MLKIKHNLEIDGLQKNENKTKIIITHTSRDIKNYIISLKTRLNGKYNKIPNYVVDREGEIFKCIEDEQYSNYMNDERLDKKSIIISLENLGWLEKTPLSAHYNNWIQTIYKGEIYERKWRDYFFWHPYTEEQLEVTAQICKYLFNKFPVENKCIGHNTKVDGIENFDGVSTRSNYSSKYTDVSPSFDFEKFLKYLENE